MKKVISVAVVALAVAGVVVLFTVRSRAPGSAPTASPDVTAPSAKVAGTSPAETPPTGAPTAPRPRSPAPSLPPLSIPESLKIVFGAGGESFLVRQEAVQQLGSSLSDQEVEALYHLLYRKAGEDSLQADELNALKNEVANVLKSQQRSPAVLIGHLTAMFDPSTGSTGSPQAGSGRATTQDAVWRDYCVQHLGTLYRAAEGDDRAAVRDVFWSAADEKTAGIAGTALIALVNNLEESDIDRQAVADKAVTIAGGDGYPDAARVTALQIGAKLADPRILPLARSIADGSLAVPLRASAIAAIGTLGDTSDRSSLEKHSQSTDIRLRTAAQSALHRLQDRHP
jgi:hypothetical protein